MVIINHIEHYTVKISDRNSGNNYVLCYTLIDPSCTSLSNTLITLIWFGATIPRTLVPKVCNQLITYKDKKKFVTESQYIMKWDSRKSCSLILIPFLLFLFCFLYSSAVFFIFLSSLLITLKNIPFIQKRNS